MLVSQLSQPLKFPQSGSNEKVNVKYFFVKLDFTNKPSQLFSIKYEL